jgi:hypothetical protein
MAVIALSVVGATPSGNLAGYAELEQGALLGMLRDKGHRLVEPTGTSATHFVSMNHNRTSFAEIAPRIPSFRRQLVVFEPRVVLPDNYKRSVRQKYGPILAMGTRGDVGAHGLPLPQHDWREGPTPEGIHLRGTTALINANKISMISGSLYGLRREVIGAFDQARLPLTLAGSNWDRRGGRALLENARSLAYAMSNGETIDIREWARRLPLDGSVQNIGVIGDKQAVLAQVEFAVVIENSATYISEKLFDAVVAGCVPLYVGPSLSSMDIPDNVAIQLGKAPKANEFPQAVRALSDAKKAQVLKAGEMWLADDVTYQTWAMPNALMRLASAIDTNVCLDPEKT